MAGSICTNRADVDLDPRAAVSSVQAAAAAVPGCAQQESQVDDSAERDMVTMTNGKPATAPTAVRQLDTPAASALADLAGMFEDMQTVLRCCERLVTELANTDGEPDDLLAESLWTTALLSYRRCFVPGQRGMTLTEDDVTSLQLQGDVLEWHKVLLQLREHYADTPANPRERFSVGVSQDPDGSANGVAITSARQPTVDDRTVRQTGAIAYELSRVIDGRITEHQEKVLTNAQSLSKSELEALPLIEVSEDDIAADSGDDES